MLRTDARMVVVRQPMFDLDRRVFAYELLCREPDGTARPVDDGVRANARVLSAALDDIGLQAIVGDRRAFVNVDRAFLLARDTRPFSPEQVGLELLEDQEIDAELLDRLRELVHVDGFTLGPRRLRLRRRAPRPARAGVHRQGRRPRTRPRRRRRPARAAAAARRDGPCREVGGRARVQRLPRRRVRAVPGLLLLPTRARGAPADPRRWRGRADGRGRPVPRRRDVRGDRTRGDTRPGPVLPPAAAAELDRADPRHPDLDSPPGAHDAGDPAGPRVGDDHGTRQPAPALGRAAADRVRHRPALRLQRDARRPAPGGARRPAARGRHPVGTARRIGPDGVALAAIRRHESLGPGAPGLQPDVLARAYLDALIWAQDTSRAIS